MTEDLSSPSRKMPSLVLMIVFVILALSLTSLVLAITAFFYGNEVFASYLLLAGFIGVGVSTYFLFQSRKRLMSLKIETPPTTTTVECRKCGFKSVREFRRGDYVFRELEPCQKCNDKMMITAIYREVKEKEKRAFP
jgi:hypothetical protein